eukprot:CAMPEP_0113527776 /NCGR_PEP_ID=MMETSP0015_2-20120614/1479_1 /TAXON_ID=2838 /ORGANISM="Odontella" /LENGTH=338 /DNA_ID=CAMNT_0000426239 /DNA_START=30 /DNA_END=1046 /DNA_ORIENTATION=- /assembly_acc=CAM_ASM_000160
MRLGSIGSPKLSLLGTAFLLTCPALGLQLPRITPPTDPRDLVIKHVRDREQSGDIPPKQRLALACSVLHCPQPRWSEEATFTQRATDSRIVGRSSIVQTTESFDHDFQSDSSPDVSCAVGRISSLSASEVAVQWNVTWVPPTAGWLLNLPGEKVLTPYNHLSREISVFSWGAVGRLLGDVVLTGRVRVPLACIEGRSILCFRTKREEGKNETGIGHWELKSIKEELSYAEDLRRGVLKNRKCASDLRLFLETGRRPPAVSWTEWESTVSMCLPWRSVPGSGSLDIEPMSTDEGSTPALIFLIFVATTLIGFANLLAPELVGQSLFGPPNIIQDPFYSY